MGIKNSIENIVKVGALAGFMAFMTNCRKEPIVDFQPTHLSNIYETNIAGNLERPGGLSANYNNYFGSLKNSQESIGLGVLAQGPLFYINLDSATTDFTKSINPKIQRLVGNLQNLSLSTLIEFNIQDYFHDFNTPANAGINDSTLRPIGLTLDNLILKDGTVLFSSNSSDKIFQIGLSGISIYLQDKELRNITDMIQGTDGKIYAVEAPLLNYQDSSLLVPKRVISIDKNKNINVEFELPSENSGSRSWVIDTYFNPLRIVENSELGKQYFGTEFYVSDLIENVIYKINANKRVEILANNLKYPSSLAVSSAGDLFYTTTPFWFPRGLTDIEYPTELNRLNPFTGEPTLIYRFDKGDINDYAFGSTSMTIQYNGESYVLPLGFNVSSILFESSDKFDFLLTNSLQGTLKLVSANKN